MIPPTKDQIDQMFREFANDGQKELSREARRILKDARESEHFRAVVVGFQIELLKSITAAGVLADPMAMVVLLSFMMGHKWAEQHGAGVSSEPAIDQSVIDRMLKGMEEDTK